MKLANALLICSSGVLAALPACSRCGSDGGGSEHHADAAASSAPVASDAKLYVDDVEYPVRSAIRVRRGDLSEDWIVSSDGAGCEMAREPVAGKSAPRVRLRWTMSPNFVDGSVRPINPWGLFMNERGAAGHGFLAGAQVTLEIDKPDSGDGRAMFRLPSVDVEWLRGQRMAAHGKLGMTRITECAPEPSTRIVESLRVTVGKVRVGIRSVKLFEAEDEGKLKRRLALASTQSACNDFDEGELQLMTTTLGEERVGVTLIGRAVPYREGKTLNDTIEFSAKHRRIEPTMTEVDVELEGHADMDGLRVDISGRATARLCRAADLKKKRAQP